MRSGDSSDSTWMWVSSPRQPPVIVRLSAEPLMKNRVTCSRRRSLTSIFAILPNRESWVSSQNATAALKYDSGGGAVSSPAR